MVEETPNDKEVKEEADKKLPEAEEEKNLMKT